MKEFSFLNLLEKSLEKKQTFLKAWFARLVLWLQVSLSSFMWIIASSSVIFSFRVDRVGVSMLVKCCKEKYSETKMGEMEHDIIGGLKFLNFRKMKF
jgi:hypothetical protein